MRVGVDRRAKPGATCLLCLNPITPAFARRLSPVALVTGVSCLFVVRRTLIAVCPGSTFASAAPASGTARPRLAQRLRYLL